ncbi:hypothetical protein [Burkholderia sp. WTPI3]|uniref:hypothetical protein n=1 Tax=Burkholderia sp. WTPI3 TaxID=2822167 RepID=UPI001F3C1CBB|nr:hypothetical protein [Burkholderia sp. WTPI3]
MSITPETIVSDVELAALVKVSTRRIRQLAEQGTLERVGVNQYELGPSFQALLEEAAGTGSALVRERTRKLAAEATRAELALARERGEVALIREFEQAWSNRYTIIKQTMLNIPGRAVLQLIGETNERRFKDVLREEIVLGLTHAANSEINTPDDEGTEDEQDD